MFSHQNEQHTAKLNISTILKHFYGDCQKNPFISKKFFSHRMSQNELNYAFLVFRSIFAEIDKKVS